MPKLIFLFLCLLFVSCNSNKHELQNLKGEIQKLKSETRSLKSEIRILKSEIQSEKKEVQSDEKITKKTSELTKILPNDKVYVLYNSDHEGTKPNDGRMQFKYETVYTLPLEIFNTRTQSLTENFKINSKGIRLSEIGHNRSPIWNKKGDKIAYLNFVRGNNFNSFENGRLVVRDVSKGDLQTYDNLKAKPYGLAWDESGNIIAYGQENSICTFNIEENKTQSLYYSDNKLEGISISPDGNYIMFMTRDGKESNDKDGWSPNLLNVNTKESIKISGIDDGITTYNPYMWHKSSSKVIFKGNQKNEKHLGEFWEYDLTTKKFKTYNGDLDGYQDQSVRYWNASKLDRVRKYISPKK